MVSIVFLQSISYHFPAFNVPHLCLPFFYEGQKLTYVRNMKYPDITLTPPPFFSGKKCSMEELVLYQRDVCFTNAIYILRNHCSGGGEGG